MFANWQGILVHTKWLLFKPPHTMGINWGSLYKQDLKTSHLEILMGTKDPETLYHCSKSSAEFDNHSDEGITKVLGDNVVIETFNLNTL